MKKQLALALTAGLATSAVLVGTGGAANADNNALSVTFESSDNAATATGVAYTWSFAGPSGNTTVVDKIKLTLPTGTTGVPSAPIIYGLPTGCSYSFDAAGTTITLTNDVANACVITDSNTLGITLDGLKNPAAGSLTTRVEMDSATPTDLADGSASVSIAPTSTSVSIMVPESLTFTNNRTDIQMMAFPGGDPVKAPAVNLTVVTNAAGGYKLNGCVTSDHQLTFSGSTATTPPTIPQAKTSAATELNTTVVSTDPAYNPGFGAAASLTGTNAVLASPWSGTGSNAVLGYDASCTDTGGDALIASNPGPTNGDTLSLVNSVKLPGTQQGGRYTGEIDYTVTPTY